MNLNTRIRKAEEVEGDILSILSDDYRPALTVRELKVETAVRGLGHQGTGYSVETIRAALSRLRKAGLVRCFGRRIGKQKRTLMWVQPGLHTWDGLTSDSQVCRDLGIPEFGTCPGRPEIPSVEQSLETGDQNG